MAFPNLETRPHVRSRFHKTLGRNPQQPPSHPARPQNTTTGNRAEGKRFSPKNAATASTPTNQSIFPPLGHRAWCEKSTARLRITPTTEAVMPDRAADSHGKTKIFSICGPPTKMKRNEGRKVTHVVSAAHKTAAVAGGRDPGFSQPPTNPTNCSTMINCPSAVSHGMQLFVGA